MKTSKFLAFTVAFWLLAALLMYVNAWPIREGHLDVVIVRYIYFPLIGLMITFAMTSYFRSNHFRQVKTRLILLGAASFVAGLMTAVLLNPITYLMSGYNIHAIPHEILSTGTLYFILIYFAWSVIYLQLGDRSILRGGEGGEEGKEGRVFRVEKMGEKRLLQERDICCIMASGDYVELVTASNRYLIKDSLASLEDQLDGGSFKRVHRSSIVNGDKIESVVAKSGGAFEIVLDGGETIVSSRSYKAVVEGMLPRG